MSRKSKGDPLSQYDLRPILAGWPYRPNEISVRKVLGLDGRDKIQLRVDLGLLQMESTGRPDGERPHGMQSLLHYHRSRLEDYQRRTGTDVGFMLTAEECDALREEAVLYYQRYLSLFVLQEYRAVERDTARNLDVADLCRQYAAEVADRLALEQYRPYILMMNRRSAALRLLQQGRPGKALEAIEDGLEQIREFFEEYSRAEAFDEAREVVILRALAREISDRLPTRRLENLKQQLHKAVEDERYEEAADLRDQINKIIDRRQRQRSENAQ